jgi:hypothetical protein
MSSLDHKLICLMKRDACTQILKFILINDDQSIFLSMQIKCTLFHKRLRIVCCMLSIWCLTNICGISFKLMKVSSVCPFLNAPSVFSFDCHSPNVRYSTYDCQTSKVSYTTFNYQMFNVRYNTFLELFIEYLKASNII